MYSYIHKMNEEIAEKKEEEKQRRRKLKGRNSETKLKKENEKIFLSYKFLEASKDRKNAPV